MEHEYPTCSVCYNDYDQIDCKPVSLPCGHSLCSKCVNQLTKRNPIHCPICVRSHPVPSNNFPVNYLAIRFIEHLQAYKTALHAEPPINEYHLLIHDIPKSATSYDVSLLFRDYNDAQVSIIPDAHSPTVDAEVILRTARNANAVAKEFLSCVYYVKKCTSSVGLVTIHSSNELSQLEEELIPYSVDGKLFDKVHRCIYVSFDCIEGDTGAYHAMQHLTSFTIERVTESDSKKILRSIQRANRVNRTHTTN
ncbi:hypothetical protein QTN25_009569 [Entamoeba marina]